jgi:hypothetical protein
MYLFELAKSDHDYSWNVTRLRIKFELTRHRFLALSLGAIRGTLHKLALGDEVFMFNNILPATPWTIRKQTIFNPAGIYDGLSAERKATISLPFQLINMDKLKLRDTTWGRKGATASLFLGAGGIAAGVAGGILGFPHPFSVYTPPVALFTGGFFVAIFGIAIGGMVEKIKTTENRSSVESDHAQTMLLHENGGMASLDLATLLPKGEPFRRDLIVFVSRQKDLFYWINREKLESPLIDLRRDFEIFTQSPIDYVAEVTLHGSSGKIERVKIDLSSAHLSAVALQNTTDTDALNLVAKIMRTKGFKTDEHAEISIHSSHWQNRRIKFFSNPQPPQAR